MTTLDEIGGKLAAGKRLTPGDAAAMVQVHDLLGLGALADEQRRRRHGDRVTFVRVHEIEATSALSSKIGIPPGAGEVRIVGEIESGDHAVTVTRQVVSSCADVPVTGFALDGLAQLCAWDRSALVDLLIQLKQAGLSLVAEARADRVREPDVFETLDRAGLGVGCLTVGAVDDDGRVDLVRRVASWDADVQHVHAFNPLPRTSGPPPTTGYADVRQVAVARVLVDNIDSIQVDWRVYGPKLAQVALTFGADDVDRVSPLDTLDLGWRRAPLQELTRNVLASALVPVQRNGRFETLKADG